MDQLDGADAIAFKVEFLGLDMTTRNLFNNPQQGTYISTGQGRLSATYCGYLLINVIITSEIMPVFQNRTYVGQLPIVYDTLFTREHKISK
jgi:hypothetical protein